MSQKRSDNILADLPKVLDDKMGMFDGAPPKWRPYNNVAEFTTRFPEVGRAEGQMFWVRSPDFANNAELYAVRKDKTTYKIFDDFQHVEIILFPTATGIINIDFTDNSRDILFPNPDIRAYIVEAVDDDEELTEIVGFVPVITKESGVITNLKASYIAGNVLVLLRNN